MSLKSAMKMKLIKKATALFFAVVYLQVNVAWAGVPSIPIVSSFKNIFLPKSLANEIFTFHAPIPYDQRWMPPPDQTSKEKPEDIKIKETPKEKVAPQQKVMRVEDLPAGELKNAIKEALGKEPLQKLTLNDILTTGKVKLTAEQKQQLQAAFAGTNPTVALFKDSSNGNVYVQMKNNTHGATLTLSAAGAGVKLDVQSRQTPQQQQATQQREIKTAMGQERGLAGQVVQVGGREVRLKMDEKTKQLIPVDVKTGQRITDKVFTARTQDAQGRSVDVKFAIHHFEVQNGQVVAKGAMAVNEGQTFKDGQVGKDQGNSGPGRETGGLSSHGLDVIIQKASGQIFFEGKQGGGQVAFTATVTESGKVQMNEAQYQPVTAGSHDVTVMTDAGEIIAQAGAQGTFDAGKGNQFQFSNWTIMSAIAESKGGQMILNHFGISPTSPALVDKEGFNVGRVTLNEKREVTQIIGSTSDRGKLAMNQIFFSQKQDFAAGGKHQNIQVGMSGPDGRAVIFFNSRATLPAAIRTLTRLENVQFKDVPRANIDKFFTLVAQSNPGVSSFNVTTTLKLKDKSYEIQIVGSGVNANGHVATPQIFSRNPELKEYLKIQTPLNSLSLVGLDIDATVLPNDIVITHDPSTNETKFNKDGVVQFENKTQGLTGTATIKDGKVTDITFQAGAAQPAVVNIGKNTNGTFSNQITIPAGQQIAVNAQSGAMSGQLENVKITNSQSGLSVTLEKDPAQANSLKPTISGDFKAFGETVKAKDVTAVFENGKVAISLKDAIQINQTISLQGVNPTDPRAFVDNASLVQISVNPLNGGFTGIGRSQISRETFVPAGEAGSGGSPTPLGADSQNIQVRDVQGGQLVSPLSNDSFINISVQDQATQNGFLVGQATVITSRATNIVSGEGGATLMGQKFSEGIRIDKTSDADFTYTALQPNVSIKSLDGSFQVNIDAAGTKLTYQGGQLQKDSSLLNVTIKIDNTAIKFEKDFSSGVLNIVPVIQNSSEATINAFGQTVSASDLSSSKGRFEAGKVVFDLKSPIVLTQGVLLAVPEETSTHRRAEIHSVGFDALSGNRIGVARVQIHEGEKIATINAPQTASKDSQNRSSSQLTNNEKTATKNVLAETIDGKTVITGTGDDSWVNSTLLAVPGQEIKAIAQVNVFSDHASNIRTTGQGVDAFGRHFDAGLRIDVKSQSQQSYTVTALQDSSIKLSDTSQVKLAAGAVAPFEQNLFNSLESKGQIVYQANAVRLDEKSSALQLQGAATQTEIVFKDGEVVQKTGNTYTNTSDKSVEIKDSRGTTTVIAPGTTFTHFGSEEFSPIENFTLNAGSRGSITSETTLIQTDKTRIAQVIRYEGSERSVSIRTETQIGGKTNTQENAVMIENLTGGLVTTRSLRDEKTGELKLVLDKGPAESKGQISFGGLSYQIENGQYKLVDQKSLSAKYDRAVSFLMPNGEVISGKVFIGPNGEAGVKLDQPQYTYTAFKGQEDAPTGIQRVSITLQKSGEITEQNQAIDDQGKAHSFTKSGEGIRFENSDDQFRFEGNDVIVSDEGWGNQNVQTVLNEDNIGIIVTVFDKSGSHTGVGAKLEGTSEATPSGANADKIKIDFSEKPLLGIVEKAVDSEGKQTLVFRATSDQRPSDKSKFMIGAGSIFEVSNADKKEIRMLQGSLIATREGDRIVIAQGTDKIGVIGGAEGTSSNAPVERVSVKIEGSGNEKTTSVVIGRVYIQDGKTVLKQGTLIINKDLNNLAGMNNLKRLMTLQNDGSVLSTLMTQKDPTNRQGVADDIQAQANQMGFNKGEFEDNKQLVFGVVDRNGRSVGTYSIQQAEKVIFRKVSSTPSYYPGQTEEKVTETDSGGRLIRGGEVTFNPDYSRSGDVNIAYIDDQGEKKVAQGKGKETIGERWSPVGGKMTRFLDRRVELENIKGRITLSDDGKGNKKTAFVEDGKLSQTTSIQTEESYKDFVSTKLDWNNFKPSFDGEFTFTADGQSGKVKLHDIYKDAIANGSKDRQQSATGDQQRYANMVTQFLETGHLNPGQKAENSLDFLVTQKQQLTFLQYGGEEYSGRFTTVLYAIGATAIKTNSFGLINLDDEIMSQAPAVLAMKQIDIDFDAVKSGAVSLENKLAEVQARRTEFSFANIDKFAGSIAGFNRIAMLDPSEGGWFALKFAGAVGEQTLNFFTLGGGALLSGGGKAVAVGVGAARAMEATVATSRLATAWNVTKWTGATTLQLALRSQAFDGYTKTIDTLKIDAKDGLSGRDIGKAVGGFGKALGDLALSEIGLFAKAAGTFIKTSPRLAALAKTTGFASSAKYTSRWNQLTRQSATLGIAGGTLGASHYMVSHLAGDAPGGMTISGVAYSALRGAGAGLAALLTYRGLNAIAPGIGGARIAQGIEKFSKPVEGASRLDRFFNGIRFVGLSGLAKTGELLRNATVGIAAVLAYQGESQSIGKSVGQGAYLGILSGLVGKAVSGWGEVAENATNVGFARSLQVETGKRGIITRIGDGILKITGNRGAGFLNKSFTMPNLTEFTFRRLTTGVSMGTWEVVFNSVKYDPEKGGWNSGLNPLTWANAISQRIDSWTGLGMATQNQPEQSLLTKFFDTTINIAKIQPLFAFGRPGITPSQVVGVDAGLGFVRKTADTMLSKAAVAESVVGKAWNFGVGGLLKGVEFIGGKAVVLPMTVKTFEAFERGAVVLADKAGVIELKKSNGEYVLSPDGQFIGATAADTFFSSIIGKAGFIAAPTHATPTAGLYLQNALRAAGPRPSESIPGIGRLIRAIRAPEREAAFRLAVELESSLNVRGEAEVSSNVSFRGGDGRIYEVSRADVTTLRSDIRLTLASDPRIQKISIENSNGKTDIAALSRDGTVRVLENEKSELNSGEIRFQIDSELKSTVDSVVVRDLTQRHSLNDLFEAGEKNIQIGNVQLTHGMKQEITAQIVAKVYSPLVSEGTKVSAVERVQVLGSFEGQKGKTIGEVLASGKQGSARQDLGSIVEIKINDALIQTFGVMARVEAREVLRGLEETGNVSSAFEAQSPSTLKNVAMERLAFNILTSPELKASVGSPSTILTEIGTGKHNGRKISEVLGSANLSETLAPFKDVVITAGIAKVADRMSKVDVKATQENIRQFFYKPGTGNNFNFVDGQEAAIRDIGSMENVAVWMDTAGGKSLILVAGITARAQLSGKGDIDVFVINNPELRKYLEKPDNLRGSNTGKTFKDFIETVELSDGSRLKVYDMDTIAEAMRSPDSSKRKVAEGVFQEAMDTNSSNAVRFWTAQSYGHLQTHSAMEAMKDNTAVRKTIDKAAARDSRMVIYDEVHKQLLDRVTYVLGDMGKPLNEALSRGEVAQLNKAYRIAAGEEKINGVELKYVDEVAFAKAGPNENIWTYRSDLSDPVQVKSATKQALESELKASGLSANWVYESMRAIGEAKSGRQGYVAVTETGSGAKKIRWIVPMSEGKPEADRYFQSIAYAFAGAKELAKQDSTINPEKAVRVGETELSTSGSRLFETKGQVVGLSATMEGAVATAASNNMKVKPYGNFKDFSYYAVSDIQSSAITPGGGHNIAVSAERNANTIANVLINGLLRGQTQKMNQLFVSSDVNLLGEVKQKLIEKFGDKDIQQRLEKAGITDTSKLILELGANTPEKTENGQLGIEGIIDRRRIESVDAEGNKKYNGYADPVIILGNQRAGIGLDYKGNFDLYGDGASMSISYLRQLYGRVGRNQKEEVWTRTLFVDISSVDSLVRDASVDGIRQYVGKAIDHKRSLLTGPDGKSLTGEYDAVMGSISRKLTANEGVPFTLSEKIVLSTEYLEMKLASSALRHGLVDAIRDRYLIKELSDIVIQNGGKDSKVGSVAYVLLREMLNRKHSQHNWQTERGEVTDGFERLSGDFKGLKQEAIQGYKMLLSRLQGVPGASKVIESVRAQLETWKAAQPDIVRSKEMRPENGGQNYKRVIVQAKNLQDAVDRLFSFAEDIVPDFGGSKKNTPQTISDIRSRSENKTKELESAIQQMRSDRSLSDLNGRLTPLGRSVGAALNTFSSWNPADRRNAAQAISHLFAVPVPTSNEEKDSIGFLAFAAKTMGDQLYGGNAERVNVAETLGLVLDMHALLASDQKMEIGAVRRILSSDRPYDEFSRFMAESENAGLFNPSINLGQWNQRITLADQIQEKEESFQLRNMVETGKGNVRVSIPAQLSRIISDLVTLKSGFYPWSDSSRLSRLNSPTGADIMNMASSKPEIATALSSILLNGMPLSSLKEKQATPREVLTRGFSEGAVPLDRVRLTDLNTLTRNNTDIGWATFLKSATDPANVSQSRFYKPALIAGGVLGGAVVATLGIAAVAGASLPGVLGLGGIAAVWLGQALINGLTLYPVLRSGVQVFTGDKAPQLVNNSHNSQGGILSQLGLSKDSKPDFSGVFNHLMKTNQGRSTLALAAGAAGVMTLAFGGVMPVPLMMALSLGTMLATKLGNQNASPRSQALRALAHTGAAVFLVTQVPALAALGAAATPFGGAFAKGVMSVLGGVAAGGLTSLALFGIAKGPWQMILNQRTTLRGEARDNALKVLAKRDQSKEILKDIREEKTKMQKDLFDRKAPLQNELRKLESELADLKKDKSKDAFIKTYMKEMEIKQKKEEIIREVKKGGEGDYSEKIDVKKVWTEIEKRVETGQIDDKDKFDVLKMALMEEGVTEKRADEIVAKFKENSKDALEKMGDLEISELKDESVSLDQLLEIKSFEKKHEGESGPELVRSIESQPWSTTDGQTPQEALGEVFKFYFGRETLREERMAFVQLAENLLGFARGQNISSNAFPDLKSMISAAKENNVFSLFADVISKAQPQSPLAGASQKVAQERKELFGEVKKVLTGAGLSETEIQGFINKIYQANEFSPKDFKAALQSAFGLGQTVPTDVSNQLSNLVQNYYFNPISIGLAAVSQGRVVLSGDQVRTLEQVAYAQGKPVSATFGHWERKAPYYQALSLIQTQGSSVMSQSKSGAYEIRVKNPNDSSASNVPTQLAASVERNNEGNLVMKLFNPTSSSARPEAVGTLVFEFGGNKSDANRPIQSIRAELTPSAQLQVTTSENKEWAPLTAPTSELGGFVLPSSVNNFRVALRSQEGETFEPMSLAFSNPTFVAPKEVKEEKPAEVKAEQSKPAPLAKGQEPAAQIRFEDHVSTLFGQANTIIQANGSVRALNDPRTAQLWQTAVQITKNSGFTTSNVTVVSSDEPDAQSQANFAVKGQTVFVQGPNSQWIYVTRTDGKPGEAKRFEYSSVLNGEMNGAKLFRLPTPAQTATSPQPNNTNATTPASRSLVGSTTAKALIFLAVATVMLGSPSEAIAGTIGGVSGGAASLKSLIIPAISMALLVPGVRSAVTSTLSYISSVYSGFSQRAQTNEQHPLRATGPNLTLVENVPTAQGPMNVEFRSENSFSRTFLTQPGDARERVFARTVDSDAARQNTFVVGPGREFRTLSLVGAPSVETGAIRDLTQALAQNLIAVMPVFNASQVDNKIVQSMQKILDDPIQGGWASQIDIRPIINSLPQATRDQLVAVGLNPNTLSQLTTLGHVADLTGENTSAFKSYVYSLVFFNAEAISTAAGVMISAQSVKNVSQELGGRVVIQHTQPRSSMPSVWDQIAARRIFVLGDQVGHLSGFPMMIGGPQGLTFFDDMNGALLTVSAMGNKVERAPSTNSLYQSIRLRFTENLPSTILNRLVEMVASFRKEPTQSVIHQEDKTLAKSTLQLASVLHSKNLNGGQLRAVWGLVQELALGGSKDRITVVLNEHDLKGLGLEDLILQLSQQIKQTQLSPLMRNMASQGQLRFVGPQINFFLNVSALPKSMEGSEANWVLGQINQAFSTDVMDAKAASKLAQELKTKLAKPGHANELSDLLVMLSGVNQNDFFERLKTNGFVTRGEVEAFLRGQGGSANVQLAALNLLLPTLARVMEDQLGLKLIDKNIQVSVVDPAEIGNAKARSIVRNGVAEIQIGLEPNLSGRDALVQSVGRLAHELAHLFVEPALANAQNAQNQIPVVAEEAFVAMAASAALNYLGLEPIADTINLATAERVVEMEKSQAYYIPYTNVRGNQALIQSLSERVKKNQGASQVVILVSEKEWATASKETANTGLYLVRMDQVMSMNAMKGETMLEAHARLNLGTRRVKLVSDQVAFRSRELQSLVSLSGDVVEDLVSLLSPVEFGSQIEQLMQETITTRIASQQA